MRLVAFSDPHIAPRGTPPAHWHNAFRFETTCDRLRKSVDIARSHGADAIALLGDLSHLGDKESCSFGVDIVASSGLDVWIVPGNHDSLPNTATVALTVEKLSNPKVRVADAAGEVHQHCRVAGSDLAPTHLAPQPFSMTRPSVADWGGEFVIWLTHYPVLSSRRRLAQAGFAYPGDAEGHEQVADILSGRTAPTLVLNGHLHARDASSFGTVLQASVAALIEPPFEVMLVDIEPADENTLVRIQCVSVEDPGDEHLPVLVSAETSWSFQGGRWHRRDMGSTPPAASASPDGLS